MSTYIGTDDNGTDVYLDASGYVDQNGTSITPSGTVEAVLDGSGTSMSSVSPNPTIQPAASSPGASSVSQAASVMGQWGATIAGIVSGTPVTVTSSGAKVGTAAAPLSGSSGMLLLLVIVAVVLVLAMKE